MRAAAVLALVALVAVWPAAAASPPSARLAALDKADVVAVEATCVGELFLGEPSFLAEAADGTPEAHMWGRPRSHPPKLA